MQPLATWVDEYINRQHAALASVPAADIVQIINLVHRSWQNNRHIFIIGNGGSAANASHFAVDLGKGASDSMEHRFRVTSLTDNTPWLTAISNDYEYADVFVRQLQNFARIGDVLICISVSGSSPNVIKAAEWAKANGMCVIAFVGAKRGHLVDVADNVVVVADTHFGRVEDVHMHILHMICYYFIELKPSRDETPAHKATADS